MGAVGGTIGAGGRAAWGGVRAAAAPRDTSEKSMSPATASMFTALFVALSYFIIIWFCGTIKISLT